MPGTHVALLRAIAHVPMAPLRAELVKLGFAEVQSFGTSGNLIFTPAGLARAEVLEAKIARATGAATMVRSRAQLGRALAANPLGAHAQAAVLFLARPPTVAGRRALAALDLDDDLPAPVLRGREVFFVFGTRLRGRKTTLDLERTLGVTGTFRALRVVSRLYEVTGG